MKAVLSDLMLGVRLAVGGGRTSKTALVRLALGTIGVGLAVWVLLIAAAVQPAMQARAERTSAQLATSYHPPGVDGVSVKHADTEFHGMGVDRVYVRPSGPNAPLMPGLDRYPAPGESYVSPALAKLLDTPESGLLKPRLPERVVGTIGQAGLVTPNDLRAVIGADDRRAGGIEVYEFGEPVVARAVPAQFVIILTVGLVTLLIPVFIFVASSARIAGAERDRRLAALRLVGAGARQARRIAAAESLVSAALGLALGGGLFLALRASAADIVVANENFFPSDLTPPAWLVVLIMLSVPAVALLTTQFALRSTIIEPLGVVRQSKPVGRRRMTWRLLVVALGVILLFFADGSRAQEPDEMLKITIGATLLLLGVPTLLPWVLERLVSRFKGGGTASFQLAVRRLQLDIGTPARVVGGLAVVLAGAVALQTVLMGQLNKVGPTFFGGNPDMVFLTALKPVPNVAWSTLDHVPGVAQYHVTSEVMATDRLDRTDRRNVVIIRVADCPNVWKIIKVSACTDGDAFVIQSPDLPHDLVQPGRTLAIPDYSRSSGVPESKGWLRLPDRIQDAQGDPSATYSSSDLVLTPGALRTSPGLDFLTLTTVFVDPHEPEVLEHIRNAMDPFVGDGLLLNTPDNPFVSNEAQMFLDLRKGLMVGSLFTLLVASVSLLVVALEQMRERRRAVAALSATGVPIRILVRSLAWQNAIPMLLALALAVASGMGLALLVFRLMDLSAVVDWANIGVMSATAGILILLITTLTLPTLRSATHLNALRTE